MAGIYQAALWCDDCTDSIKNDICTELWDNRDGAWCPDGTNVLDFDNRADLYDYLLFMDENNYDSDEWPKHCDGSADSDTPEHCGAGAGCINAIELSDGVKIGGWLENSLTTNGEDYVKEAVREGGEVAALWKEWYDYLDYPAEPTIPVNSIEIPGWVQHLCAGWSGGQDCMLYAVSSTGGLTTGTNCPVSDFDDDDDRMRKWYLSIWLDFASDIGYVARMARKSSHEDSAELTRAGNWADEVCDCLTEDYGLEDW